MIEQKLRMVFNAAFDNALREIRAGVDSQGSPVSADAPYVVVIEISRENIAELVA